MNADIRRHIGAATSSPRFYVRLRLHTKRDSLEKVLVDFFDVQGLFDPTSNVVADHQPGQLLSVYENDPFAQEICSLPCRRGECRGGNEQALRGLVPIETPEEVANCPSTDIGPQSIAFGLYVNAIQTKGILIDDTVDAVITTPAKRAAGIGRRTAIAHP